MVARGREGEWAARGERARDGFRVARGREGEGAAGWRCEGGRMEVRRRAVGRDPEGSHGFRWTTTWMAERIENGSENKVLYDLLIFSGGTALRSSIAESLPTRS
jgi:hypothetical protein